MGTDSVYEVYGQTGSGKTFTMEGDLSPATEGGPSRQTSASGLIPRTFSQLFSRINALVRTSIATRDGPPSIEVHASFLQIYNEKIHDLVNPDNPKLSIFLDRKSNLKVTDAAAVKVTSAAEAQAILVEGSARRAQAVTLMNRQSSRSHSVFLLTVARKDPGGTTRYAQVRRFCTHASSSCCTLFS